MPRLGLGNVDLSVLGGTGQDVVTTIDDFVFESFSAGQMHPIRTSSRTNLITYSEDISNASWNKGNVTVASNFTTAPNSTLTADKITKGGASGNDRILIDGFSISNNTVFHFSAHVKNNDMTVGGKTTIAARIKDGGATLFRKTYEWGSSDLSFASNFDGGTRTNEILEDLGNGWYRIGFSFTSDGTEVDLELDIDRANAGATTSLFAWGFQLEQDGFVSNYIPTSGSTVTVSTTLNDTSNVWDFDGTDIMIAEDPEDEGFWEEGGNIITGFTNGSTYAFDTLTRSGTEITSAIVSSAFAGAVSNVLTLSVGDVVTVVFNYTKNSGDDLRVVFSSSSNGAGTQISNAVNISSSGLQSHDFTITATGNAYLQIGTGNSGHSINFAATGISANLYEITPLDI